MITEKGDKFLSGTGRSAIRKRRETRRSQKYSKAAINCRTPKASRDVSRSKAVRGYGAPGKARTGHAGGNPAREG